LTSALTNFGAVVVGNNSTAQNYQVYGTSILDADSIHVTAPTNFQISRDNSTFYDTLNIQAVAGDSVPHTTVYARFSPGGSAYGAQTGDIAHASTGATTQNQAAAGSGVDTEPTTQPTGLSFSDVTGGSMTVNWTRGGTPGDSVIVACRASSDLSADPADATDYAANAAYGSGTAVGGGFVVYKGTGTSVGLSNLAGSTTYYVRIYEYNDGGVLKSANYFTTSPLAGSQATSAGTQLTDHFRSRATGNWGDAATWESSADSSAWIDATLAPADNSAKSVVVRSGHTVTVAANISIDQVTVDAGGQVTVAAGNTYTIANNGNSDPDLVINGTFLNQGTTAISSSTWTLGDGATFIHNASTSFSGTLAAGTLSAASNFIYRGSSTVTPSISTSGRTYGNLTFESTSGSWSSSVSGTGTLTVNGDFVLGADITLTTTQTGLMTFAGDYTVDGTLVNGAGTQAWAFTGAGATVAGSGTFSFEDCTINSSTSVALARDLAVSGTLTLTSGTFAVGAHTLALTGPAIAGTPANLSADNTSSLSFGGSSSGVGIPSSVAALNDLTIGNVNGVAVNGDLTVHGTLTMTIGDLTLSSGSVAYSGGTLRYNGTADRTTTDVEFPATNGPANLTVDQHVGSTPYTVDLHGDRTLAGTLDLANGVLAIGAHTLTLNGDITTGGGELAGGTASNLVMGGSGASTALPSVELNDLTIDRAGGIATSGDVFVWNALTLSDGPFAPGPGSTLTIVNPIAGTAANYAPDSLSNLYIYYSEVTGIVIPSSCTALAVLTVENPNVALGGDLAITAGGALFLSGCGINGDGHQISYRPTGTWLHYAAYDASLTTTGVEWPATAGPASVEIATELGTTTLHADRTVTGELSLTYGALATGSNTITVAGTLSRSDGYVDGNLRMHAPAGSGGSLAFAMGVNGGYSPLVVTFDNVTTAGYLTCTAKYDAGGYSNASDAQAASKRYWNLVRGIDGSDTMDFDSCTVQLWYADGDFNDHFTLAAEDTMKCGCRYDDGQAKRTWWDFFPVTRDAANNTVTLASVAGDRLGRTAAGADFLFGAGYWVLAGTSWTGVGNDTPAAPALPRVFALSKPYPNPARGRAAISLGLPDARHVRMEVFNLLGQRIAVPADRMYPAGTHQIAWDLKSSNGQRVSDGVYFYRLSAGDRTVTGRLTVLR
jgi:hypothetical protein